jgi:ADP-heptose:LPS heptosyltransferase
VDLIDQTDLRQLLRLVYHAHGACGSCTFLQYVAAAFEKPYVLVDSAREPASWTTYPHQTSLAKHGALPCCPRGSCWRTKLSGSSSVGEQVWEGGSIPVARCSAMISPEEIVRAIEVYHEGRRLTGL